MHLPQSWSNYMYENIEILQNTLSHNGGTTKVKFMVTYLLYCM